MENKIKTLHSSICVPSTIHAYSLGMQYIQDWFFSKFSKNYFKTIHIDQKHVLDDFRKSSDMYKNLKKLKPSVSITPQLSFEFDRDNIDLYNAGLDTYVKRHRLDNAFLKDRKNNVYLGIELEQLEINFNFRIRVSTRAQQIDLYKYLNLALRIGSTQGKDVDMDFHIPYSLMIQLAQDVGFSVTDNKIDEPLKFLSYLNNNSAFPILYKLRTINGKNEFFIRLNDVYVHLSCLDMINADDGERENMLYTNYIMEFTVVLKIPAPKMYIYYSMEEHDKISSIENENENRIGLYNIKIPDIPEMNDKGWGQYIITSYYADERGVVTEIDFKELIQGSELEKIIEYTKSIYISPNIFIDFKLFNNGIKIDYDIDWDNMKIKTKLPIVDNLIDISLYVDLNYMKEQMITINGEKYNKRINY